MRIISAIEITNAVERLCIEANYIIAPDMENGIEQAIGDEKSPTGREILRQLLQNASVAREKSIPLCQDTGMAVVFADIGQDLHIEGGEMTRAINEGIRRGYRRGYLRDSIVSDPLNRVNTGDNTPSVIHYDIVEGDHLKLVLMSKGFGSENTSALKMLKPSDGTEGVLDFVTETVSKAGPDPCPPIIVGVGLGGTMEKAALLAKKSLLRKIGVHNTDPEICILEDRLLRRINCLGIGPGGLGGTVTALAVNIEIFPTHIAGLPVAVNIGCHSTRHAEAIL